MLDMNMIQDYKDNPVYGHCIPFYDGEAAFLVDIYVSKGMSDSLNGKVMITSSGRSDAIARAQPILSAMCEKLYIFEGEVGAGSFIELCGGDIPVVMVVRMLIEVEASLSDSIGACGNDGCTRIGLMGKIKMVNGLLEGIHLVASAEAIALGVQAGIHPWIIYDIIANAAGNSWVFKNHVPQLLRGSILDMAKSLPFPLPLLAVAHQQLISGSSYGHGHNDATLVKVWEKVFGVNLTAAANAEIYSPLELGSQITAKPKTVKRVGFIGLGAMGFGMATSLLKSNFCVLGFDVYKPTLSRFANAGGLVGESPAEVSKDVDVLVIMVTNEAQAESVLFGDLGAVKVLPPGASIILSSTVSPGFVIQLERRLKSKNSSIWPAIPSGENHEQFTQDDPDQSGRKSIALAVPSSPAGPYAFHCQVQYTVSIPLNLQAVLQ
ncbi:L-threonate dehydrogenase [Vitis vinifera]|uniref:L-threonate dehydrogenase n=1 Tax=Vitis vinifera TaxID=29760 RepID=A0A438EZ55_VITVI|nr:L-threonate dehydrogenase [Vitis vinifera]